MATNENLRVRSRALHKRVDEFAKQAETVLALLDPHEAAESCTINDRYAFHQQSDKIKKFLAELGELIDEAKHCNDTVVLHECFTTVGLLDAYTAWLRKEFGDAPLTVH